MAEKNNHAGYKPKDAEPKGGEPKAGKVTGNNSKPLIVLGITGSIAAVRSFDLCRELRRHGFEVQVVMSSAGEEMITKDAMEFASGREVISRIGGLVEHVKFFGKNGIASLFLVAPATANTISKIAMGIDDTTVTTFATVAIGSGKPVLLAPAMHKPMYEHPIVIENLEKLKASGVKVIAPLEQGDKAKIAGIESIVFEVEKALSPKKLGGRKVLVASGAIRAKVDDIRVLTNISTGRLGSEIAAECARQGAEVKFIGNKLLEKYAGTIGCEEANFADELEAKVLRELDRGHYDYMFCPAAIPDFRVKGKNLHGKVDSSHPLKLELEPRAKMIEKVRQKFPSLKIIAFKALWDKSRSQIEKEAAAFVKRNFLHTIVATDLKAEAISSEKRSMFFCGHKARKWIKGTRAELAADIIREI
ncbi:Dihydromethanopterin reductase (acceptor) [uncultured archaeon]|nr:Dihydromethanopterin reductase (acceptor) [uncultured archaeon]